MRSPRFPPSTAMSAIKRRGDRYHATPRPEDLKQRAEDYAEKASDLPIMFDELAEFDERDYEETLRACKSKWFYAGTEEI